MQKSKINVLLIGIYNYDGFSEYFDTNHFFDSTIAFDPILKRFATPFV